MRLVSRSHLSLVVLLVSLSCQSPREAEMLDHHESSVEDRVIVLSPAAIQSAGVTVQPISLRRVMPVVEVTGHLGYDERRMAVSTARMGGRISEIVIDYGATVLSGTVLAWIDSPDLGTAQAEYLRALSAARVGEAGHERAKLLLEGEAISHGEFLRRQGDWQSARAQLAAAVQTLLLLGWDRGDIEALESSGSPTTLYPVRAPIAGRVTERNASVGQVVASDTTLFVIAELDELWLMLQLFEKDLPAISVGSVVSLQCESHPQDRFEGTIDFVADIVDPHSRTISARAVIDNSKGDLKPGMFVYAQISGTEDDSAPSVPSIPISAIARFEEGAAVFVVTEEGGFERRDVQLGRQGTDWVEVVDGLELGEDVVVTGTFALKSEALKGGLEGHDH